MWDEGRQGPALKVGSSLSSRVSGVEMRWEKETGVRVPVTSPDLDLSLHTAALVSAVANLNFAQLKGTSPNFPPHQNSFDFVHNRRSQ